MVAGKPYSFLHIDKAEIDLDPTLGLYDERVYQKAADNLKKFETLGVYAQDHVKKYYFYRQTMDGRAQTGIVGCASIDDYLQNKIKKHELTRADKELDRIRHVDTCAAQTGPIFLAYRESEALDRIIQAETAHDPLYDFVADDGIAHTVWESSSREIDEQIEREIAKLNALYIADGHHRAASAVKAGLKRRNENPAHKGNEDYNFFLSVIFPANSLKILDYNRVLRDLNGLSAETFLEAVQTHLGEVTPAQGIYRPKARHEIGIFVGGKWYSVKFKAELCKGNGTLVDDLDCAILQKYLLSPVLGIDDPRTDKRIDFVGGIRGLGYLERRCTEDAVAAIAMYPVSMDELMSIADEGQIMPPKSTWFEPKLLSGLFIHKI